MLDTLLHYAHVWGTLGLFVVLALSLETIIHELEKK